MATHKDLEFHAQRASDRSGDTFYYNNFPEACGQAAALSVSRGGEPINVDVIAWSEGAARAWSGDDGVNTYREDPDASVFERIVIVATSRGRIA